jgi:hypothetical protein
MATDAVLVPVGHGAAYVKLSMSRQKLASLCYSANQIRIYMFDRAAFIYSIVPHTAKALRLRLRRINNDLAVRPGLLRLRIVHSLHFGLPLANVPALDSISSAPFHMPCSNGPGGHPSRCTHSVGKLFPLCQNRLGLFQL